MSANMEEGAKNWQVVAVEKRQDQAEKFQSRIEDKLDKILERQITAQQFEDRIASITNTFNDKIKAQEEYTKNQVKEVHLKYGPVVDNLKWATRGIVLLALTQLVAFVLNTIGTK